MTYPPEWLKFKKENERKNWNTLWTVAYQAPLSFIIS